MEGEDFNDFLYILLSGRGDIIRKAGYTGSVWVDELDLHEQAAAKTKNPEQDISYIPRPRDLPAEIKVREFLSYFERSPFVRYSLLAYFRSLLLRDQEIIKQDIDRVEAESATSKPAEK